MNGSLNQYLKSTQYIDWQRSDVLAKAKEVVEQESSIAAFGWRYEAKTAAAPQTVFTSPESVAMSKELKSAAEDSLAPPPYSPSCYTSQFKISPKEYALSVIPNRIAGVFLSFPTKVKL